MEAPVHERFDGEEHRRVDTLQRACEDVRPEEGLIRVDADPPHVLLLRGVERAETAPARNLEHDAGAARDLGERQLLALREIHPVVRVAPHDLDARDGLLGTGDVARDVAIDRRLFEAADGADHIAARAFLGKRAEVADQVADLLLPEDQPFDVLRLAFQVGVRHVDDRKLRVRELLRDRGDRISLRETDPDDEVVALAGERGHVRHVVGRRGRLHDAPLDAEHTLRLLQAVVGELVEPVVVELTLVRAQADLEHLGRRSRRAARRGLATGYGRERYCARNERDAQISLQHPVQHTVQHLGLLEFRTSGSFSL